MQTLEIITINLPIPPKRHYPELHAFFGDALLPGMPGGLRDLVMCTLEHPENQEQFMQGAMNVIHNFMDEISLDEDTSPPSAFEEVVGGELDAQLSAFYQEYLASLRALLGPQRWVLEEVIDALSGTGVVVKMARHDGWYVPE